MLVQIQPDAPLSKARTATTMQIPSKYFGTGSIPVSARPHPANKRALICLGGSKAEHTAVNRKMWVRFPPETPLWSLRLTGPGHHPFKVIMPVQVRQGSPTRALRLTGQDPWFSARGCEFESHRAYHLLFSPSNRQFTKCFLHLTGKIPVCHAGDVGSSPIGTTQSYA